MGFQSDCSSISTPRHLDTSPPSEFEAFLKSLPRYDRVLPWAPPAPVASKADHRKEDENLLVFPLPKDCRDEVGGKVSFSWKSIKPTMKIWGKGLKRGGAWIISRFRIKKQEAVGASEKPGKKARVRFEISFLTIAIHRCCSCHEA